MRGYRSQHLGGAEAFDTFALKAVSLRRPYGRLCPNRLVCGRSIPRAGRWRRDEKKGQQIFDEALESFWIEPVDGKELGVMCGGDLGAVAGELQQAAWLKLKDRRQSGNLCGPRAAVTPASQRLTDCCEHFQTHREIRLIVNSDSKACGRERPRPIRRRGKLKGLRLANPFHTL